MWMRSGRGALALTLALGCQLNAEGLGSAGGGGGETSSGSTDPTLTDGDGTASGDGDGESGLGSSSDTGGEGSTSTGEPSCDDPMTFYPDEDGDGYGDGTRPVQACQMPVGHVEIDGDCNDQAPTAYPGAEELCDGFDNDCDTKRDEWSPANTEVCNGCGSRRVGTIIYYACAGPMTWHDGQDLCRARGAELASVADMAENDTIRYYLEVAGDYDYAFIGYNDIEVEGEFEWSDGSPTGFELWADLQPDTVTDAQDCVTIHRGTGEWLDIPCLNPVGLSDGVVCRDPEP